MRVFNSIPGVRLGAFSLAFLLVWASGIRGMVAEAPGPPNAQALSEYNINLGSKYGVGHGSSVSHETMQAIMTGAGKGNRGAWV
jgi:hypothetical protein